MIAEPISIHWKIVYHALAENAYKGTESEALGQDLDIRIERVVGLPWTAADDPVASRT